MSNYEMIYHFYVEVPVYTEDDLNDFLSWGSIDQEEYDALIHAKKVK